MEGFSKYFAHQTRLRFRDGTLDVTVPTGMVAEMITRRFAGPLVEAARAELAAGASPEIELKISVNRAAFSGALPPAQEGVSDLAPLAALSGARPGASVIASERRREHARRGADPVLRHKLEEFIVGEANRLAFSAAEQLADPEMRQTFSLLFVHGICGLGKTHLLQGIANRFRERRPRASVRYMTAEAFTNEYVGALRSGRLDAFRKAYRSVELLCLDDVQFLSNKTSTQQELLHTFDAIDLSGARVALASDEHPRQVRKLSESLVSRFMSGMVVRLESPDPALRERIVVKFAQRRGMRLDPAAAKLVAHRVSGPTGSIRDLEGALVRIDALTRLLPELSTGDGQIGLVVVRKALGMQDDAAGAGRPRRPVRVETIAEEVCRTLHVDLGELVGKGRHKRVVLARAITAHLSRSLTTLSYPDIARGMGRPNHSTIVTACQRIAKQIEKNETPDFGGETPPGLAIDGLTVGGLCEQIRQDILRLPAP